METMRRVSEISQDDLYNQYTVFNTEKSGDQSVRIFCVENKSYLCISQKKDRDGKYSVCASQKMNFWKELLKNVLLLKFNVSKER